MGYLTIGLILLAFVLFFVLRGRTRVNRDKAEEAARRAVERRMNTDE